MWTTLMIENWFRREWKLRFKWGMMRFKHTEIPRATFHGKYIVSTVNGMTIETHHNKCFYWFKRIISVCITFICVLLVISATLFIWNWQGDYNESDNNSTDKYVAMLLGMVN